MGLVLLKIGDILPGKLLRIIHDERIVILALNRPGAANALDGELLRALLLTFGRLKDDPAVDGILLTGEGNCFCAGADIAAMEPLTPTAATAFAELGQKVMFAVEMSGKPVIAAVHGCALGGGLELALACDFIVAGQSAQFALPAAHMGIIPAFGGTQRLPRLVGKALAKELIFTGDRISATKAYEIGLVNRVLADETLLAEATALLRKICSRGLVSLRMAKEIIDAGYDLDLRTACLLERDAFAICFTTEDQKEGMGAFVEKRPPLFKGR